MKTTTKLPRKTTKQSPQHQTTITIKNHSISQNTLTIIAGPCSIESKQQIMDIAAAVSQNGATILRGGAFKPRTSPYDFQGLGEQALTWLQQAALAHNMLSISEVMTPEDINMTKNYVDILQIGSRNMQNTRLLQAIGQTQHPVLLKRGFAATYQEFLLAAEYILNQGNPNVILCERGIRTFETYTRNTLDIAAIPALKTMSHLPVFADPSHGTGRRELVCPMAKAAGAAGADGLMIEVHTQPNQSISDAEQTICPQTFANLMQSLAPITASTKPINTTHAPQEISE